MTDITELAQRLKLEVHRAVSNFNPQMNIKTRDLKELVEALEKAQKRISRIESRSVKLPKAMSIDGGAYCSAHAHYDSDGDYYDRTDVEEMLAAAGIKWEAE
ncbi:hypothetical protein ACWUXD_01090 [Klebsiella pneumoniae]|uniref:hypothetical protein n=1 Tax=Klebsiella pneumoniae complex TaxID=3390273 RepID=UPI00159C3B75|nr:hypothetical protein [Klebsiella pneumoniae]HBW1578383.1 hypothetical protein [Klebsiella quasipneumoniae subsp. quasipneumoniae]NVM10867.1 hypothetical protein [Klebsiella pneumoniae]HBT2017940.1 hypothetical protein [Klebsiella pneumoniae]HBW1720830.1 hypothetical protein [Klebsiella quasipneumoniae subsp. quasipneumoniae]HBW1726815.1 hypothetical protein [Klebsiella quasipneumoniae subsp. quasipneumoniae]